MNLILTPIPRVFYEYELDLFVYFSSLSYKIFFERIGGHFVFSENKPSNTSEDDISEVDVVEFVVIEQNQDDQWQLAVHSLDKLGRQQYNKKSFNKHIQNRSFVKSMIFFG